MESQLKIIQCLQSHISSTLTKIKLEKLGYTVKESHVLENMSSEMTICEYDLILLDASIPEEQLRKNKLIDITIPVLYMETDRGVNFELDPRFLIKTTFEEEEFLHKYHYAEEMIKQKSSEGLNLKSHVLRHYSGDEALASKVSSTFLEGFEASLKSIEDAFKEDQDDTLVKRVHSFKGTLSALGETPAAKLVRKMEILVKARQRQIAKNFFKELRDECHTIAEELKGLTS